MATSFLAEMCERTFSNLLSEVEDRLCERNLVFDADSSVLDGALLS